MKKLFFTFSILSLAFFSCNNATEKKSAETETGSAENASLPEAASLTGDNIYTVVPGKASIKWHAMKKLVDWHHNGVILLKSGELAATNGILSGGTFTVDMTTMHSIDFEGNPKYEKLMGHLKSDDFFDVEKFPTTTFNVTSVEPLEGNIDYNTTVFGNLTIKGITNNISFPASIAVSDTQLIAKAQFSIDRSKWNVRYGSETFFDNLGDGVIKNEIDFDITFVADPK